MNAIALQIDRSIQPARAVHPMWNLLRKEWRESRGSLVAGLIIFGVVPLTWHVIYFLIAHEPGPPFAMLLLAVTGWLYALALGAHTVCRDWGQAEEHFLLARPVTPALVITAKLIAGLLTLALVWLAAAVADGGNWLLPMIAVAGILLAAYTLAFAAAVLTRRTLIATLLAGLVLFIWVAAPLIWQPLQFLHPKFTAFAPVQMTPPTVVGALGGWPFLISVMLGVSAAILLALTGSRQERSIRIGHKSLAWVIALVVLGLFVAATTEVGNSMVVLDTEFIPASAQAGPVPNWHFASDGNRCLGMAVHAGLRLEGWSESRESVSDRQLVAFRVDDSGAIQDLRHGTLWFTTQPGDPHNRPDVQPVNLRTIMQLSHAYFGDDGSINVTGLEYGAPGRLFRMRIGWPPGEEPRVISKEMAVLPAGNDSSLLLRFATTQEYALAEYALRRTYAGRSQLLVPGVWQTVMYRFDWTNQADLETEILPSAEYVAGTEEYERLISSASQTPGNDLNTKELIWHAAVLEHGKVGLYARRYAKETAERPDWSWRTSFLERSVLRESGFSSGEWRTYNIASWECLPLESYAFVADNLGLRVLQRGDTGEARPIGEYRASPLSAWLRNHDRDPLKLLNGDQLADLAGNSLVVYDVSNPARPTRIGFYNLAFNADQGQVFTVGKHIIVRQLLWLHRQDQLTVLAPPGGS